MFFMKTMYEIEFGRSRENNFLPVLGAALAIGSTVANFASQLKTNKQNQANYEKSFNQQQANQETTWQREDTQAQRAVQDYTAAGFSPLAAVGQGTSSSPVSMPTAGQQQAPTLDASSFVQLAGQLEALKSQERNVDAQIEAEKDMQTSEHRFQSGESVKQREFDEQEAQRDRDATRENLMDTLDNASAIAAQNNNTQMKIAADQLNEVVRANNAKETLEAQSAYMDFYKSQLSQVPGAHLGKKYDNYDEYQTAMNKWSYSLEQFLTFNSSQLNDAESSGGSKSTAVSGGANGSVSAGLGKASASASLGAQASISDSASQAYSYNQSQKTNMTLQTWLAKNPMPILSYDALK